MSNSTGTCLNPLIPHLEQGFQTALPALEQEMPVGQPALVDDVVIGVGRQHGLGTFFIDYLHRDTLNGCRGGIRGNLLQFFQ
jgi:hypothetical protein